MDSSELINHTALGRFFGVKANGITKSKIPNKYRWKYNLLIFFIDMWMHLIKGDNYTHKEKKS